MFNYQRAMEITKRRQKYFNYPKTNNTFICQNSADDSLMMVKFNNFPKHNSFPLGLSGSARTKYAWHSRDVLD